MVHISVYTTPRVRLHFSDTNALCHTFTEELIRLSNVPPEKMTPGFSYEKHLEDAVTSAISLLHLPLEAQLELPGNGVMRITLDLNNLLMSCTPSGAVH
jgi:hypothetical protein